MRDKIYVIIFTIFCGANFETQCIYILFTKFEYINISVHHINLCTMYFLFLLIMHFCVRFLDDNYIVLDKGVNNLKHLV